MKRLNVIEVVIYVAVAVFFALLFAHWLIGCHSSSCDSNADCPIGAFCASNRSCYDILEATDARSSEDTGSSSESDASNPDASDSGTLTDASNPPQDSGTPGTDASPLGTDAAPICYPACGNGFCAYDWCGTPTYMNCPAIYNGSGDGCDCGCQFTDADCLPVPC